MIEFDPDQAELERKHREMLQRYRNVFGTPEGRMVLRDILSICHWGVPLNDEIQRAEYNVGVAIARMSGIMQSFEQQMGLGED